MDGLHTNCSVCDGPDGAEGNEILLCDGPRCHRGYHLQCLEPPLYEVPTANEWFCPVCSGDGGGGASASAEGVVLHVTAEVCDGVRRDPAVPSP